MFWQGTLTYSSELGWHEYPEQIPEEHIVGKNEHRELENLTLRRAKSILQAIRYFADDKLFIGLVVTSEQSQLITRARIATGKSPEELLTEYCEAAIFSDLAERAAAETPQTEMAASIEHERTTA